MAFCGWFCLSETDIFEMYMLLLLLNSSVAWARGTFRISRPTSDLKIATPLVISAALPPPNLTDSEVGPLLKVITYKVPHRLPMKPL